ncbi:hypothetical protein [Trichocoleus sp. AS-A1]
MQLIVEQGNDYLVGVKGNQPKLLQQAAQGVTGSLKQMCSKG